MTLALVAFLIAAIIPVFFGRIRSAPLWLALQALALGWNAFAQHNGFSIHALVALLEVLAVRVAIAPLLLRWAIHRRAEPNLALMPSNLFVWALAIGLIVLAFEFGAPALIDPLALTLGVVGATVAMTLLLLSTNDSPPVQLLAVLFMENALALFEALLPEPWPLLVHGALSVIYLLTVGVGSWLIAVPDAPATVETGVEGRA